MINTENVKLYIEGAVSELGWGDRRFEVRLVKRGFQVWGNNLLWFAIFEKQLRTGDRLYRSVAYLAKTIDAIKVKDYDSFKVGAYKTLPDAIMESFIYWKRDVIKDVFDNLTAYIEEESISLDKNAE